MLSTIALIISCWLFSPYLKRFRVLKYPRKRFKNRIIAEIEKRDEASFLNYLRTFEPKVSILYSMLYMFHACMIRDKDPIRLEDELRKLKTRIDETRYGLVRIYTRDFLFTLAMILVFAFIADFETDTWEHLLILFMGLVVLVLACVRGIMTHILCMRTLMIEIPIYDITKVFYQTYWKGSVNWDVRFLSAYK
jgi:hypothetical protein